MTEKILEKASFRGCISILRNSKILLEKAYGYADLANEIPTRIDTRFATASAGKIFVAVVILKLIEDGKLSLNEPIGSFIEPLYEIDPSVTIEQLLSHTSGVPDYFDESIMDDYEELWLNFPNYRVRSCSDLLPLIEGKPMLYPRGTKFLYNNMGYVLLALVIEKITGMVFDEYLQKSIFIPCGMDSTGYFALDMLPSRCANHYIYDEKRGGWRTNIFSVDAKGTGAGGAYSTVGDINRFWDALLGNRLLSDAITAKMLENHSGSENCYGWGIWRDGNDGHHIEGCDPGVSFISYQDARENLRITLVSNYGDNVWSLMREIRRIL